MKPLLTMLVDYLQPFFGEYEYSYHRQSPQFRREESSGDICAVSIDVLKASLQGYAKIAVYGHIRITAIQAVYLKYNPFVLEKDRKRGYTVNVNCDNLYEDTSLASSVVLNEETIVAVGQRIWGAIFRYVLPFLKMYCDKSVLIHDLETASMGNCVVSDPVDKYCILLSNAALNQDAHVFEKYRKEFLDYCHRPHATVFLPLAEAVISGIRRDYLP